MRVTPTPDLIREREQQLGLTVFRSRRNRLRAARRRQAMLVIAAALFGLALAYGFGRAAQAASDNDQLMEALHAVR